MEWTTIGVDRDTHERLAELKESDEESFDSLLRRLIEQH